MNLFEDKSVSGFNNHNFNILINKNSNLKNYIFDINKNQNLRYSFTNIDIYENSNSENFIYSSGSKFSKYEGGGVMTQKKIPFKREFKDLKEGKRKLNRLLENSRQ